MIYFVEDDASIRELVTYALSNAGWETRGFSASAEFWRALDEFTPQLILLDIMLPEEDGLTVLRKLKAKPRLARVPVMMLTAKSSEYDKVVGLDLGADDYVTKPFGMMELISRVRALLRRSGPGITGDEYTAGCLKVSLSRRNVTVDGEEVALTYKEFELLRMLLKNRGKVLTRDSLLDEIWGYAFDGESRTVDVHVRSLRLKLGKAGDLIETVRGVGYRIGGGKTEG